MSNESEIKRLEERVLYLEMFLEMTIERMLEQFKSATTYFAIMLDWSTKSRPNSIL